MTLPIGTAEERELIVDAMADAIWSSRKDAPDDDYSLRVHLSRDEARRTAEAALNVSALQSRIAEVEALLERVGVLEALAQRVVESHVGLVPGHCSSVLSDAIDALRASLTQGGE